MEISRDDLKLEFKQHLITYLNLLDIKVEDIKDDVVAPDAFLDETAYITLDMVDAKKLANAGTK